MPLITFQEALNNVAQNENKTLVLGNGFSRSCLNTIFNYEALYNRADFNHLSPYVRNVFESIDSYDFEKVINTLRNALSIVNIYESTNTALINSLEGDANGLRDSLINAISNSHPEYPRDISDARFLSCRGFLNNFTKFFTVNYDLLLYWALRKDDLGITLNDNDGFRRHPVEGNLYWNIDNTEYQNVFYLHGALHLFDNGIDIIKAVWSYTGISLIENVRGLLNQNRFPLFVSEGSSNSKLNKIKHSEYLAFCYNNLSLIDGAAFIYGMSLDENDSHITKQIKTSNVNKIFVSIYGDENSEDNTRIRANALTLQNTANNRQIYFYSADTCNIWNEV